MGYAIDCPWAPEFSWVELQCRCVRCVEARLQDDPEGFNGTEMQAEFMRHVLVLRRDWYRKPMPVNSAYRCPAHSIPTKKRLDAEFKGREYIPGAHASGQGIDVGVSGADFVELLHAVCAYNRHLEGWRGSPAFTGIGIQQKGLHRTRYLHLDNCAPAHGRPRPHGWSY